MNRITYLKMAVLLIGLMVGFMGELQEVLSLALTVEMHQYLLIIPAISVYYLYRRREILSHLASQPVESSVSSFTGAALLVATIPLHFQGTYSLYSTQAHIAVIPLYLLGGILLIFGPHVARGALGALVILLFMIPVPPVISNQMSVWLSDFTASSAYLILKSIIPVKLMKIQLWTAITTYSPTGEVYSFMVRTLSSGIISITGWTAFAVLLCVLIPGRWREKLILVAAGYPLLMFLNVLRISLLVWIGREYGVHMAFELTHLTAGMVMALIAFIILFAAVGGRLNLFAPLQTRCPSCGKSANAGLDYCWNCGNLFKVQPTLKPSLKASRLAAKCVVVVAMAALILTPILIAPPFVMASSGGEIITSKGKHILSDTPEWKLESVSRYPNLESSLTNDVVVLYKYISPATYDVYLYVWLQVTDSPVKFHTWEVCYPLQKNTILVDKKEVPVGDTPTFVTVYSFQEKGKASIDAVVAWIGEGLLRSEGRDYPRIFQLTVIAIGEELHRAGLIKSPDDHASTESNALTLALNILKQWNPLEEQADQLRQLYLGFFRYQPVSLLVIEGLAVAAFIDWGFLKGRRRGKMPVLSEEEKAVLRSLPVDTAEAAGDRKIAWNYKHLTGKQLDVEELHSALQKLELHGLAARRLGERGGAVKVSWRLAAMRLRRFNLLDLSMLLFLFGMLQLVNAGFSALLSNVFFISIFLNLFALMIALGLGVLILRNILQRRSVI